MFLEEINTKKVYFDIGIIKSTKSLLIMNN